MDVELDKRSPVARSVPRRSRTRARPQCRPAFLAVVLTFVAAGCATGPSFLDTAQTDAVLQARSRAQSELGCESGSAEVVARETLRAPPPQRVAYQVLVTSCGQRHVFAVECALGQGCFAAAGRPAR